MINAAANGLGLPRTTRKLVTLSYEGEGSREHDDYGSMLAHPHQAVRQRIKRLSDYLASLQEK